MCAVRGCDGQGLVEWEDKRVCNGHFDALVDAKPKDREELLELMV